MINYMLNGKFAIHLVVGLIKKILLYKNELFCIYVHSKNKIEIELNLYNYATKSDLNNASDMDTSQFANLKLEADKLAVDKLAELHADILKPAPTDLSKLVL